MTSPKRALIIIDAQNEYFDGVLPIQSPDRNASIAKIVEAIDAAESAGVPIAVIQHTFPEGAPVFARGSHGWDLHPSVAERVRSDWKASLKSVASVFSDDEILAWLRERGADTVTLVGYMTNNCVVGTAAAAEPLGFSVEVLRDATGAISLANSAGQISGENLHNALMVLLNSNFAAVSTTSDWSVALEAGASLPKSNLGESAFLGNQSFPVPD